MSSSSKQLFCAPCSRKFDSQHEFNEHLKSHLSRNGASNYMKYIQPHECLICHRRFDIKSHLELHFNTHLLNLKSICPFCRLDCKSNYGLELHSRQCSENYAIAGCTRDLEETNSNDSNITYPSCSQSITSDSLLFGKTFADDGSKFNENQIKFLALVAAAASITQEHENVEKESTIDKLPENSYGGLFNGKDSKAYKTYLNASYRCAVPKPHDYISEFQRSEIKYPKSDKSEEKKSDCSRKKSYECENCNAYFSRKCVLETHRQKHILEEKNNEKAHFKSSKILKSRAGRKKIINKKQELITNSIVGSNKSVEQYSKTGNATKELSVVLPRMRLPRKYSVKALKLKMTKEAFLASKIIEDNEVPEETDMSDKSVEQNKYKSITPKTTSDIPSPRIRLDCKSYVHKDESKTENSSKATSNMPIQKMRLSRKYSAKVLKPKISKKAAFLASKVKDDSEVSEEIAMSVTSIERNKNKKITPKTTSDIPNPRIRLDCKSFVEQGERKIKYTPKMALNMPTPRMHLPRKCAVKVMKSKISKKALNFKNNVSPEVNERLSKPGRNFEHMKLNLVRRESLASIHSLKIKKKYSKTKSYDLRKRNKNEDEKESHNVEPKRKYSLKALKSKISKKNFLASKVIEGNEEPDEIDMSDKSVEKNKYKNITPKTTSEIPKCPMKNRKRNMELRFKCDVCQKAFNDRFKVRRHYVQHTGEKPYLCPRCKTRFTRTDHLKRHSLICGKKTKSKK